MKSLLQLMFIVLALLAASPAQAIPPIEQARLDNGLRVLLMQAHNVPMVVMRLTLAAGSRLDPAKKAGSAALLAAMLSDHTAIHDDVAWADMLDAQAIRLGAGASRDSLSISLTVLKEALREGVGALSEATLHPGWNKKRFAILRSDAVAAAQKSLEEPGVRAAEETAAALYPRHGYGHRSGGSVDSLPRIKLADLQALYKRQFRPQGAVLAVSGDITMGKLLALIGPAFADWQGAPEKTLQATPQPEVTAAQQHHVRMPTQQMTVQLARLGPSRFDKAFFANMLLNHMLGGGGFASRLMNEVREQRGLVYGVYSYFVPLAVPGPFVISFKTRADQAAEALAVVRQVMRDMHDGKISAAALAAAKANLSGSFAHRLDSNAKRVGLMSMIGFYGLPLDYLSVWADRINAVTLAEVKTEAKRFLASEKWHTIEVGPSKGRLK
ncbi:MAG: pitrilysin family protein [Mariprofundaceae bacterium]|nr:pitrilysin family protein [Mariprofundaceae bacterium]